MFQLRPVEGVGFERSVADPLLQASATISIDTSRGVEGPGPMMLRQPTERHGGNAGIDEEETMSEVSLESRVAHIHSNRTWSPLEDVAKAVAVAGELEHRIYIERRSGLYRWSLAHAGGGYPLLRVAARFLGVDYHRIYVGFRTLPDGTAIICDDPGAAEEPHEWALLDVPTAVDPVAAAELIASAIKLGSGRT